MGAINYWSIFMYKKVYLINCWKFFTLSLMYFGHSRGPSNYKIFDNSLQLSAIDFSFHTFKDVFFWNILTNFYSNWSDGTATVVHFQKSNVLRPILYSKFLSKGKLAVTIFKNLTTKSIQTGFNIHKSTFYIPKDP